MNFLTNEPRNRRSWFSQIGSRISHHHNHHHSSSSHHHQSQVNSVIPASNGDGEVKVTSYQVINTGSPVSSLLTTGSSTSTSTSNTTSFSSSSSPVSNNAHKGTSGGSGRRGSSSADIATSSSGDGSKSKNRMTTGSPNSPGNKDSGQSKDNSNGSTSGSTLNPNSSSSSGSVSLWQRAASLRRSLGKSQQRKNKLRCSQNSRSSSAIGNNTLSATDVVDSHSSSGNSSNKTITASVSATTVPTSLVTSSKNSGSLSASDVPMIIKGSLICPSGGGSSSSGTDAILGVASTSTSLTKSNPHIGNNNNISHNNSLLLEASGDEIYGFTASGPNETKTNYLRIGSKSSQISAQVNNNNSINNNNNNNNHNNATIGSTTPPIGGSSGSSFNYNNKDGTSSGSPTESVSSNGSTINNNYHQDQNNGCINIAKSVNFNAKSSNKVDTGLSSGETFPSEITSTSTSGKRTSIVSASLSTLSGNSSSTVANINRTKSSSKGGQRRSAGSGGGANNNNRNYSDNKDEISNNSGYNHHHHHHNYGHHNNNNSNSHHSRVKALSSEMRAATAVSTSNNSSNLTTTSTSWTKADKEFSYFSNKSSTAGSRLSHANGSQSIPSDSQYLNQEVGPGDCLKDGPDWRYLYYRNQYHHHPPPTPPPPPPPPLPAHHHQNNQSHHLSHQHLNNNQHHHHHHHHHHHQHGHSKRYPDDVNSLGYLASSGSAGAPHRLSWSEAINNSNNVTEPGSSNSLLATTARINAPEPDDIDCIYENMKGLTSSSSSSTSVVPSSHSTQLETSLVGQSSNHHCRKLTKDSGYESAASSANWQALTGNSNGGPPSLSLLNHSRSDSNASSVSTGGSLSPRLAATSSTLGNSRSYSYHYFDVWSIAKSTSNLPHQVEKSCPGGVGSGRSSLTRRSSLVMSHKLSLGPSMVLPAKSVPGNLDREPLDTETEEEEIASSLTNLSTLGCGSGSSSITTNGGCCPGGKRSSCSASTTGLSSLPCKCQGNFNSHNLSSGSVYGLLASKSGLDFAPASKVTRKSGFTTENSFMLRHIAGGETNHNNHGIRVSRLNPVSNSCGVGGGNNRLRCNKPDRLKSSCSTPDLLEEDSPPPTPPVRDSSLTASLWSSNQQQRSGGHIGSENGKSRKVDDESKRIPSQRYQSHGSTIKSFMFEGLKSGSNSNGCSRSTLNLRLGTLPFPSESLEQVPPPPLPPPLSSNHTNSDSSPLLDSASLRDYGNPENWSSAGSLVSAYTGHLTSSSLTTTSDYYTASSGAMTSSPSLSSLNTTATTATNGPPVSGISRSIATSGSGPSISSSPPPISYAHYHQYRRHQSHNQQHNRHYHHQCVPSVHHGSTSSGIARSAKVEQPKRQESGSVVYYDSSKSSSSTASSSSSSSSSSASSSTTSPTSSSPAAAVVVGSMSTGGGGGRTGQGRPDERKKGSKTMETSGLSRSPIGEEEVSSSSSPPSKSLPLLPQRCPSEKHLQQQPTGSGQSELSTTELKAIQKRALLEYYLKLKKKARKEKKSSESGGEEGEEETEVDQEVDGECDAGEGNHCGHQGEDKVEDDKQDEEEEEEKKKEKAVGEKHPHPHHLHHSHHCPHPFLEKQNQKSDSDCLSKSSSKSSIHLLYKPKAERKTQVGTEEGGEEAEAEAGEEEDQRVEEEISSNKVHLVVAQPSQELESLQYLRPSSSTVVTTTPNNNNAINSSSSLSSAAYSPSSSSSSSGLPSPPLPPPPANTETEVITDLPLPSPPFCTSNHSYHQSYNFHPSVGQTLQTPLQPQPQPSSSELESIIPSSCCNPSEKMRSSSSVAVSLEGRLITNPSQQSCLTIISTTTSMSTSASGPPSSESQGKKPISIPGMSANVVHQPTNNNNSSSKDLSSLKSEIATQTTGSLRRGSSPNGQLTNSHHFVGSEKESKVDLNVSLVSTEMNGVSIKEKSSLIVSSDHQSPVDEEQDEENDQCHQGKNKGRNSNNNSNEFSQTVYTRSSPIHLHPSSSPSSKPLSSSSGGGAPWSHRNLWPGHGLRETNTSPLLLESNNGKKILETYIGPESGQDQENQRPDNQSLSSAMSITTNTTTTTTGQALLLEKDLLERKAELVLKLSRKLDVLRMEKVTLTRDLEANESLGSRLLSELKMSGISESESEKISVHCEEIEKVTRLLLSLSQRLKQIDGDIQEKTGLEENQLTSTTWWSSSNMNNNNNNINNINNNNNSVGNKYPQVNSLLTKRCKLLSQLEEAVQLRDSIDRRSQLILDRILRKYFNNENHQEGNLSEFIQFLESKSKLIVELKEVKDKIEFGEKQLQALSKF